MKLRQTIATNYLKAFDRMDQNQLWKILKERGILTTLPVSWEICMQIKKQQSEPNTEQQIGSKLGKEYIKAVCCHPAYLIYMQSTSYEMLEKTLVSPLDSKKFQPVKCKWKQPWIFTRRTDAGAEVPILWLHDVNSQLNGKDSNAWKDWRQEEKRVMEDEVDG